MTGPALVAIFLVSTGLGAGCNTPYLAWTPREPLAARRGKVAIAVDDRRAEKSLGTAYGFGGMPAPIDVDAEEPRLRLTRLLAESLYTSGLAPSETATAPTARARLRLDALTCDGSRVTAHAKLDVTFTIAAPDGSPRLDPVRLELAGKGHGCQAAFGDVLDQLLDELSSRLVEGPAHEAALGSS